MKKTILFALLFLGSITCTAEILTKEAFAEKYASVVMELHPGINAEVVGELEVSVRAPHDVEVISYLDNAYANYQSTPEDIDNILKTYAEVPSLTKELGGQQFGAESIFPIIKDKIFIEQTEKLFEGSGKKGLVYEKLNDALYVLYVFDTPKAIRFMTEDDLVDGGVDKSELRALAKSNLKKAIPNIHLEGNPSELSMLLADGTYEASFILFDVLWTKEQFPVKGEIVVYIPSRDVVFITGSEDKTNLAKIRSIVYNPDNKWSHIVAAVGFIRVDEGWEVFYP